MDIIENCEGIIDKRLKELNKLVVDKCDDEDEVFMQTQTAAEVAIADKDKNLDRILEQQAQIKMIIERDGRIKSLNKSIIEDKKAIEMLRKSCSKISMDSLKNRQDLLETQATEREKFQMQQLKSIADDYRRHQDILEQRKKEIMSLKKETEKEESNRELYLADVEKNMERQLQNRQQLQSSSSFPMGCTSGEGVTDEVNNPNHIELTSIDEYAPYGAAPHSRMGTNAPGRRGGSARGRKRKQA